MSPSILSLSITPSGQINSIFPWSHSPVVCRVCDSTCRTGQEKFEAKSLTAALTERVSISHVIKLEFSFMKKVPLRWKTIQLLTLKKEKYMLQGNSDQVCNNVSEALNQLQRTCALCHKIYLQVFTSGLCGAFYSLNE